VKPNFRVRHQTAPSGHDDKVVARVAANAGDIGELGAAGVQNFLDLDDLWVTEEGEPVHVQSINRLSLGSDRCVLPTTEGARVHRLRHTRLPSG